MSTLRRWGPVLDQLLAEGPTPGATHHWLARVAAGLAHFLPPAACAQVLRECCRLAVSHRPILDREIRAAVEFAFSQHCPGPRPPQFPAYAPEQAARLAGWPAPFALPAPGEATGIRGRDAILARFAPEELVCVGRDQAGAAILRASDAAGLAAQYQFIVASPMRQGAALTREGRLAARCQANVRQRRHLVVEFDVHPKPLQASLIGYLAQFRRLRLVVDSGGKSLHAWFEVSADPVRDHAFYGLAVRLGADKTRWDAAGWVRMPGGTRPRPAGTVAQQILFLAE